MKAAFLQIFGVTALWRRLHKYKLSVVTLHGVMSDESSSSWKPLRWQMEPEVLRRYLSVLAAKYEFVSADEAIAMVTGEKPMRKHCMLLTIDDGYRNALTHALPILKEFGVRPLIFVVTGKLDCPSYYWFDRLDAALQEYAESNDQVYFEDYVIRLDRNSHSQMSAACKKIISESRRRYPDDDTRAQRIETFIQTLCESSSSAVKDQSITDPWFRPMSRADVMEAIGSGATIGSHTVSHVRLAGRSESNQLTELSLSREQLEDLTGADCDYFCFPEGSVDELSSALAKSAGYKAAFVSENGLVDVHSDRFHIRRFHLPREASNSALLAKVSGLTLFLAGVKRRILGTRENRVPT